MKESLETLCGEFKKESVAYINTIKNAQEDVIIRVIGRIN